MKLENNDDHNTIKKLIKKHKLDTKNSQIKNLNENWGGLISWLLNIYEQYEYYIISSGLLSELNKIYQEKTNHEGNLLYFQKEHEITLDRKNKLKKYINFIKENISDLDSFMKNSAELNNLSSLHEVSTILNKCKIANMVSSNNGITLPSPIDESNYVFTLVPFHHENKRHITEQSDFYLGKAEVKETERYMRIDDDDGLLNNIVVHSSKASIHDGMGLH